MNLDTIRREHLRRMAEPEDLRELRQQAERIRAERARESRRFVHEIERARLRREITDAGERPCR